VIDLNQVATGVLMGSLLIAFGLVPGLFQELADRVSNCADLLSSRFPIPSHSRVEFRQPRWFAGLGAVLIAVTLLAYFARWSG
jgi:hypothetical protein